MQKLIILICLASLVHSYPYFPKCTNYDRKTIILNSLNGAIKGACYSVTVDFGGQKPNKTKQVLNWLSVPYAQPPIKNLRFKDPLPVKSWRGTLDGTQWPYHCIQWDGYHIDDYSSEDCLYLNIFVPYNAYYNAVVQNNSTQRAPIFIWVHGGSNNMGSVTDDTFEASTLVALSEIIVVTINYRLGPFGFFTILDTDAKGNQGFLDQSLAFKWVFENAYLFGGDQSRITIGGESAGSWDVGFHLLYKPSWPYFRNAIMQSGNPADIASHLRSPDEAAKEAIKVGKKLGCNIKSNSRLFKCLQSMSTESFYLASSNDFSYFVDLFMPLVLHPDVFSQQPKRLFETGDFKRCNIMIGTNTLEFLSSPEDRDYTNMTLLRENLAYNPGNLPFNLQKYYETYNITNETGFYDKMLDLYGLLSKNSSDDFLMDFVEMITDQCYKCPAYWLANKYSEFNQNAYVYLYSHKISTSDLGPEDGAGHAEELSMVFAEPVSVKKPPLISWNSHSATTHNYSIVERTFTEQIVNYWASFIKYDNPNIQISESSDWPLFKNEENEKRNLLFLKAQNIKITKFNVSDPKCNFWNL